MPEKLSEREGRWKVLAGWKTGGESWGQENTTSARKGSRSWLKGSDAGTSLMRQSGTEEAAEDEESSKGGNSVRSTRGRDRVREVWPGVGRVDYGPAGKRVLEQEKRDHAERGGPSNAEWF